MRREIPTVDSTAHLADLHPALASLEAAMLDQDTILSNASTANCTVYEWSAEIDPTAWSGRIEAARDKPEELAQIRLQYDERALRFMGAHLNWLYNRRLLQAGCARIRECIVDCLLAVEQCHKADRDLLRPIMESRIVAASKKDSHQLYRRLTYNTGGTDKVEKLEWFGDHIRSQPRVQKIQALAFRALAAGFSQRVHREDVYTTGIMTLDKSKATPTCEGFEIRYLEPVHFVDCVNSTHPASARLAELCKLVPAAVKVCHNAKNLTGEQKGTVNEHQHASRMMEFLHQDNINSCGYGSGGNLTQQIDAQNERRREFETERQQLAMRTRYLRKLLLSLVEALKASAVETEALLAEVESDSRTTVDRYETLRIMMHNCLAVDSCLRRWVRDLHSHERTIKEDISKGAGTRALGDEFAEVMKDYGWQVERKKKELALQGELPEVTKAPVVLSRQYIAPA
jgi:hypothetical protein